MRGVKATGIDRSGAAPGPPRRGARPIVALALVLLGTGCAGVGSFTWVDDMPASMGVHDTTLVWPGDLLGVRVWGQENLSVRTRVRDDGMITVPFVNDFPAVGMAPAEIAQDLQQVLKKFLLDPVVTVTMEEARPLTVSVLGEVTRPGVYELGRGSTVLQALASAGGATPYASRDRTFVLREDPLGARDGRIVRVRLDLDKLARGEGLAASFTLRRGDVVIVE